MIGDKLLIKKEHTIIANKIFKTIKKEIFSAIDSGKKYTISVAGESGAGKSETGYEIKRALEENGIKAEVLGQDDYFVFPPKTNHNMRLKNIDQVGTYEVKLDLLDSNLFDFKNLNPTIYKPLVVYDENKITHNIMDLSNIQVLIAEGTYTTYLKYIDKKIFINRTYLETKKDRLDRGREDFDPFIEKVLKKEHTIISNSQKYTNITINNDFTDIKINKETTEIHSYL